MMSWLDIWSGRMWPLNQNDLCGLDIDQNKHLENKVDADHLTEIIQTCLNQSHKSTDSLFYPRCLFYLWWWEMLSSSSVTFQSQQIKMRGSFWLMFDSWKTFKQKCFQDLKKKQKNPRGSDLLLDGGCDLVYRPQCLWTDGPRSLWRLQLLWVCVWSESRAAWEQLLRTAESPRLHKQEAAFSPVCF